MQNQIRLSNISIEYTQPKFVRRVLQSLDLTVPEGQFVSIIGPSGCGKTTLLRLVTGLVEPNAGELSVFGKAPHEVRQTGFASHVFQSPVLFPWRTVMENVLLPLEIHGRNALTREDQHKQKSSALDMLSRVGLRGFEYAYPHQLSGGMQSRVAIARALISQPKILLMDEPFGNLDELTRTRMNMELLLLWEDTASTVLFVTHSVQEAILLSDRVVVMGPRPSALVEDVQVELERPRRLDMQDSETFRDYARTLRRALGAS